tara:strand:+ start:914 stop:1222 length:309 start_codon:yes stop_codon:yes gene_type:complete
MKNLISNQERFTVKTKSFEDSTGMQKGRTRTRFSVKVYDNGSFVKEFTREFFESWVTILEFENKQLEIECKKSESAVKNSWAWKYRKNEDWNSFLIHSKRTK